MRGKLKVSERRACRVLGQHRSTQRQPPRGRVDEERLVADMVELVRQYGRYGYRRIAILLRDAGWQVNDKHIERLWQREGLKVPTKQPQKKGRQAHHYPYRGCRSGRPGLPGRWRRPPAQHARARGLILKTPKM